MACRKRPASLLLITAKAPPLGEVRPPGEAAQSVPSTQMEMQTSSLWENKAETTEKGHNLSLRSAVPFCAKTKSKATQEEFQVTPSLCHTDPITSSCPPGLGRSSPSAVWAEISTATAALGSEGRTPAATPVLWQNAWDAP